MQKAYGLNMPLFIFIKIALAIILFLFIDVILCCDFSLYFNITKPKKNCGEGLKLICLGWAIARHWEGIYNIINKMVKGFRSKR